MVDIVERLVQAPICTIEHEAADTIETLRARVKELEESCSDGAMIGSVLVKDLHEQLAAMKKERDHWEETCHAQWQNYQDVIIPALKDKLSAMTADRDHWKANHDNRVAAARVLLERPDLPIERVAAYNDYMALQRRVAELEALIGKQSSEVANLATQLAAMTKERDEAIDKCNEFWGRKSDDDYTEIQKLHEQLAASQAREQQLREALERMLYSYDGATLRGQIREALDIHHNTSALD